MAMVEADLAVVHAAELLTISGPAPKRGAALADAGVIENGFLAARAGRIVFVGDEARFRRSVRLLPGATVLDAARRTVLPGFVDAHTHLPFAGSRQGEFVERLHGATYEEIAARGGGIQATVRATRAATLDDLVRLSLDRLDTMLLHGTTTAEAKSGYGLTPDDEIKQLAAVRAAGASHPVDLIATLLGAHVVPAEHAADRGAYVRAVIDQMIPRVAERGLARYCDVFVEEGAFTVAEGDLILAAAARHGLGLRVHAEQRTAGGGAILAARHGAASADHLECVTEAGIAALAAAGTSAVLLPGAAFFLRDDRDPPVRGMIEAGIPIVIATDFNPGTCPTGSMAAVLPLACLRYALDPAEAFVAATLNAARALGVADEVGSLEAGKRADLQVLDVASHREALYWFGTNHCRTVVKDGIVVVDDGRIVPGRRPA